MCIRRATDVDPFTKRMSGALRSLALFHEARSPCRSVPDDTGREHRMAFTYKLEREDGTPDADPVLVVERV